MQAWPWLITLTPREEGGESVSRQLCPALCDPRDCSLPGSSVPGILQASILEWVARSFSRGSSQPRDGTRVFLHCWKFFFFFFFFASEPPTKPSRITWAMWNWSPMRYQEWTPGRSKLLLYSWRNYKARCRRKIPVYCYPANVESLRKCDKVCVESKYDSGQK